MSIFDCQLTSSFRQLGHNQPGPAKESCEEHGDGENRRAVSGLGRFTATLCGVLLSGELSVCLDGVHGRLCVVKRLLHVAQSLCVVDGALAVLDGRGKVFFLRLQGKVLLFFGLKF